MSATALLLWMSARRHGSWQQFRAAVEELHLENGEQEGEGNDDIPGAFPLYQSLRFNLQRLGHAEFFAGAGGNDWRVTPPSLAIVRQSGRWLGILVGGRSLALKRRIEDSADAVRMEAHDFPGYPEQITLAGDTRQSLEDVARNAGLIVQIDAPTAILTCIPPVDDPCVGVRTELPFGIGWGVELFSARNLAWHSATPNGERITPDHPRRISGLYRFSLRHERLVLLCSKAAGSRPPTAFSVPGQVGKFAVLRRERKSVLEYRPEALSLSVPASCRPPFLVERALIMCSGVPPTFEPAKREISPEGCELFTPARVHYAEIPPKIAATTASLLRQTLK